MSDDGRANPLGSYLRARRALVTPEQAGLAPGANRRVPGLRREEVAMLAGISADYYLRLERGRDAHPSAQVLDALARVLLLDEVERDYLHGLAEAGPGGRVPRDCGRATTGCAPCFSTPRSRRSRRTGRRRRPGSSPPSASRSPTM